jgi:ubiquinone biosynthesis UbiH/UbiF/VisC/COQ6 family hydroxylase
MFFDVIIVGGGLVGCSLALSLSAAGLKIALVESQTASGVAQTADWDSRIYALGPGSVDYLTQCGAWQAVDAARTMPVEDMRIVGDDARSGLDFSAYEAGLRELAVIVENRQVQAALWRTLQACPEVVVYAPAACADLQLNNDAAVLTLGDGRSLRARLVVGADGGNSWIRHAAGMTAAAQPYGQTAVVANFETDLPHGAIARQWFRRDGILALLPLPGQRVSMVWSTGEEHADALMHLPPPELAAQVAAASVRQLGELRVITAVAAFPLRLQRVPALIKPRLALVGDAAHNMHPLAGQGVNLGFRDARELTAVLATRGAQQDCGDYYLLRRYERARREDIAAMQLATDTLQRLFNNEVPLLGAVRNFGLRLANRGGALKNLLVQHAVG